MRDAADEQVETRNFFAISRELRELKRSARPDRMIEKIQLLDELEVVYMHTAQPKLATRCRRLIYEFEYVRREVAASAKLKAQSQ